MMMDRFRAVPRFTKEQYAGGVIGTLMMVALIAGGISPRTYSFTAWLVLAAIAGFGIARRHRLRIGRPAVLAAAILLSIPLWAIVSGLWSAYPAEAVSKAAFSLGLTAATCLSIGFIAAETPANRLRISEGIWLGALASTLYLLIEVWSGQAIRIAVINAFSLQPKDFATSKWFTWQHGRVVSAHISVLTRDVAALPLLLGPAILAVFSSVAPRWRSFAIAGIAVLIALTVYRSGSESAKFALTAELAVGALALSSIRLAGAVTAACWLAACLGMPLLVKWMHGLAPQHIPLLKHLVRGASPDLRMEIWRNYATWALKKPWFGHGANHTYVLSRQFRTVDPAAGGPPWKLRADQLWPHPHNMYLQVWYDLGAAGAILFAAFGMVLLWTSLGSSRFARAVHLLTFAGVAAFIFGSYGLWQDWVQSMVAFVGLSAAVAFTPIPARNQT